MSPEVVFAPEAEEQLVGLYRYIAVAGSPEAADRYTDSIVAFCEELALFPHRGKARDKQKRRSSEDPRYETDFENLHGGGGGFVGSHGPWRNLTSDSGAMADTPNS